MTPAAYVRLDLDAVRHNLAQVRRYAPDNKIMAVIKANAYGHGITRVAEALVGADSQGRGACGNRSGTCAVDGFAVARVDEGVRLRQAGFLQPITVLQGFVCVDELLQLLKYQLAAVIHTPQQIAILQQHAHVQGCLPVWLKMDTGMNRLGFKGADFNAAYRQLLACALVEQPINLITHFANADDLLDDKTRRQIDLFNAAVQDYPGQRSIANSAGIIGWPNVVSDWVRPGLMLYGCSPFAGKTGADFGLKPVMSLHSRLIAVKDVAAGETVGYSGTWQCRAATRLGVISIGYGDGYHRATRSGAPVLVNGRRVALIGRVSMDMITVDLNSQPSAQPGDPVTLWGEGLPVEEIARHAETIPYTLLCGITQRVQVIEQGVDDAPAPAVTSRL